MSKDQDTYSIASDAISLVEDSEVFDASPNLINSVNLFLDRIKSTNAEDLFINSSCLDRRDLRKQALFFQTLFRACNQKGMRIGIILEANSDLFEENRRFAKDLIGKTSAVTTSTFIGFILVGGLERDVINQDIANSLKRESTGTVFVYDNNIEQLKRIIDVDAASSLKICDENIAMIFEDGESAIEAPSFNVEFCNKISGVTLSQREMHPISILPLRGPRRSFVPISSSRSSQDGRVCCNVS